MRAPLYLSLVLLFGCSQAEPIVFDRGSGSEQSPEAEPQPEPETRSEPGPTLGDACETDADCVPATCCHASACVAASNAPDCSDTMCTADCQFGTLDCGGSCLCQEGHCAARLSEAPDIGG